jgi:hypothetical protein
VRDFENTMTRIQASNNLRLAFNFTNSDLQDNRQGFMSFRQKRWLRIKSFLKFDWIFGGIAAIGAGFFALIQLTIIYGFILYALSKNDSMSQRIGYLLLLLVYGIGSMPLVFFVLFAVNIIILEYWRRFNNDIRAGRVNSVQIEIDSRRRSGFWFLGEEACIKLSPAQLSQLQNNYSYRLYYAPNTCEILSIEIVRVDKGAKDTIISDRADIVDSPPIPVKRLTNNKL